MKSAVKQELLNPSNLVYPATTGLFQLLFDVKQPEFIWYCDEPFSYNPSLEKLSISEINRIISANRKLKFRYFEGFCVPSSIQKYSLDQRYDYTEVIDKLFLGNMGPLGIGLFTREDLREGTELGFLGGKVITQDFKDKCELLGDYSCLSHASIIVRPKGHRAESITYTSQSYGGMLGFAQSARDKKASGVDVDHATANMILDYRLVGEYAIPEFTLTENSKAGTLLTWYYGKRYWQRHQACGGEPEQLFDCLGEPLGTVQQAKKMSQTKPQGHISEGNKYSYKGYSYFQNHQYQLAIRYWEEAYKHHEKWLEENAVIRSYNGYDLFIHALCANFHKNMTKAYHKMGNDEKAHHHHCAATFITRHIPSTHSSMNKLINTQRSDIDSSNLVISLT